MGMTLRVVGLVILMSFGLWSGQEAGQQDKPKETPKESSKETPAAAAPDASDKKNPVKSSPEILAAAKKIYGYDCAMCHGANGDGKGDLVESMKLEMKNWQESDAVNALSDEAIYDQIVKGKGKMVGEGDRLAPAKVWGLVHYVRTLSKKKGA